QAQVDQAHTNSAVAALPALKADYADYVFAEQKRLETNAEKLFHYWQQQLAGKLPGLDLPLDKPRPAIQTYNGASINFELSSPLTQKLKQLAAANDATLYMTLLAAFEVFLSRYTGQKDILVGSTVAGRLQPKFREIVGYFANTVVLRGDLSSQPSFKDFLAQIRQKTLGALVHQDYPFALLVEKLQPERDPSRSPIFQASFILQQLQQSQSIQKLFVDQSADNATWAGVRLEPYEVPQQEGQFDLGLELFEGTASIRGSFKYNTDLFHQSTVVRMATHFKTLLEAIVENPMGRVSELPLLSAAERDRILLKWNDTKTTYPQDNCIHQLFEEQVIKNPEAVAVVFQGKQLTYRALNAKANQLAHYLKTLGVKPEVLVGVCAPRSLEMIIGLLGILKAGGAYVPLDPNYPPARLGHMLNDSGVEVLLTTQALAGALPTNPADMVCLDRDWDAISKYQPHNVDAGIASTHLAYVIYTSGSTGLPKGVAIEHRSVCNLAQAQANLFSVETTSKVLQFASLSFDASVWEVVMALTQGATLVLATASELMPGEGLKTLLETTQVTHATLPPSALAVLPKSALPQLNTIIVAGEACPLDLADKWSVDRNFFNAYGPTESTVCSTVRQIETGSQKMTIGYPIANTQAYILDERLQPVPIGVVGELYIGGDSLAREYLNRPDLTQARFVESPFKSLTLAANRSRSDFSDSDFLDSDITYSQSRLYKTGDLARYLPDGDIDYLGRVDHQVKIRGFRIELGEIESELNAHPAIKQAVVMAKEDDDGNKRLIAYLVLSEPCAVQEIRAFLKAKLPQYMLPNVFMPLDDFPLMPNGKVDRQSLPIPDNRLMRSHSEYVAPRNDVEEGLVEIWSAVLKVDRIGVDDNWFELGGDSLGLNRVIARIREKFQIELPLKTFFEDPSIRKVADYLAAAQATDSTTEREVGEI
ncbi:MAG: amino acid adenylation domain-containing protein, partial [Cyanobacteria bacterium J06555_13]